MPVSFGQYEGIVSWMDPSQQVMARDQYARRLTRVSRHTYNVFSTWAPSFGDNNIKIMAGMNGEIFHQNSLKATRLDLLSTELNSFNLATGEVTELVEDIYNSNTRGFFGRVNYDYDGKYLIEVSGRYDGSSRFAKNHRWGFFPSASAGWRMSQEKFWEPMRDWFNNAKLRLSVGTLGNQQVGYYDYIQTINSALKNTGTTLDGKTQLPYATESSPVASDLTWEKVTTYDLGLDLSFFNSRLNFTGDLYIRDTKDMLANGASLPAVYGASVPRSTAPTCAPRAMSWLFRGPTTWQCSAARFATPSASALATTRRKSPDTTTQPNCSTTTMLARPSAKYGATISTASSPTTPLPPPTMWTRHR